MPRPLALDDFKKREILAMLSTGCSRRMAASYVGCSPCTIRRTADRDPDFAAKLARAGVASQVGFLKCIRNAAQKEQYWRAAAWALERMNPEDFGPRKPDALGVAQFVRLLTELTRIILEEVPVAKYRKPVLKRLDVLIAQLPEEAPVDETVPALPR